MHHVDVSSIPPLPYINSHVCSRLIERSLVCYHRELSDKDYTMAAPGPSFYFIVSPDPTTTRAVSLMTANITSNWSLTCVQEGQNGPHYFIKFGDGDMVEQNYRYFTHNPSYR